MTRIVTSHYRYQRRSSASAARAPSRVVLGGDPAHHLAEQCVGSVAAALVLLRRRERTLADILHRMRHDGCGGQAARAELLTGVEGASSRPVRRIVLIAG